MIKFLFSDILWALLLAYLSFAAYSFMPSFINYLELRFYDFRSGILSISSNVLPEIIEIPGDKSDVSKLDFEETGKLLPVLGTDETAPSLTVFMSQIAMPDTDKNLKEISLLKDKYEELKKNNKLRDKGGDFLKVLSGLQNTESPEKKILSSLKKIGPYVLPVYMDTGIPSGKLKEEPEWLKKHSVRAVSGAALASSRAEGISFNVQESSIGENSAGAGHTNLFVEQDGKIRFETPFIAYNRNLYPSIALETSRILLGISEENIKFNPGKNMKIGEKLIPLTPESSLPVNFSSVDPIMHKSSDILAGNVAAETFKGKTVILCNSSGRNVNTPKGLKPECFFVISAIKTLMSDSFISRPPWTYKLEVGMLMASAVLIMFASSLPRWLFHSMFLFAFVAVYAGSIYMFCSELIWIKPVVPMLCLSSGYLFGIIKRFVLNYELKQHKIQYSSNPPPPPVIRRQAKPADVSDNHVPTNAQKTQDYPEEHLK